MGLCLASEMYDQQCMCVKHVPGCDTYCKNNKHVQCSNKSNTRFQVISTGNTDSLVAKCYWYPFPFKVVRQRTDDYFMCHGCFGWYCDRNQYNPAIKIINTCNVD